MLKREKNSVYTKNQIDTTTNEITDIIINK